MQAKTLSTFTVNRGGASPSAILGTNLTVTGLSLTSGVVNLGTNTLIYNTNTAVPAGSSSCYFAIPGSSGGFQWHMASVGLGTYKFPVGPAGAVAGYRPVQLVTSATTTAAFVLVNFIDHDGSGTQSATNVPTSGNNRAGYIANVNITGTLPQLTSLTMEYQAADFNAGAPTVANVAIYRQDGTSWVKVGQTSNGTDGTNTTIVQSTVNLSGNNPLIVGVLAVQTYLELVHIPGMVL